MATLEVRIKYRTGLTRACYWALTVLSPVWGLMPVTLLFYNFFMVSWLYDAINLPVPRDLLSFSFVNGGLGAGIFPLFIVGLYLWFAFRDSRLVLSQQGICFPASMIFLFFTRNRPWYQLRAITLLSSSPAADYRNGRLALRYERGEVALNLRDLSARDLEQLLLGLETFGSQASGFEAVGELKRLVKSDLNIKGIKSYTNLWDDELRYRYASTTFIPLSPGSTLQDGQIKILRQLGFGGLSAIYLCQRCARDLAILKESVLPAGVDEELAAKAEEQFDREARILAGLKHPRIARVLDHFVERGHYLLIEYIPGQDLRQYVNEKGALSERAVLVIALQIAGILDYLHSRQPPVIHRDLTPENLIINPRGKIMLIDFGAANEFLHTATGTLVGKHAYMAPEQVKGKAHTQSDLYSLGCTMHFLLTGSDPTPLSASRPAACAPYVSPACDALVFALTSPEMEQRYPTAIETIARLESLLKEVTAHHAGP